jgi:thiol-disulfide isomerase/thioredoxin
MVMNLPPHYYILYLKLTFLPGSDVVVRPQRNQWKGEENGEKVVWAVFFHKEYCGACRRIRPTVEALASTTRATNLIRFAAVECVKYRPFCEKEGADTQPRFMKLG